jgi:hypothetical protein
MRDARACFRSPPESRIPHHARNCTKSRCSIAIQSHLSCLFSNTYGNQCIVPVQTAGLGPRA